MKSVAFHLQKGGVGKTTLSGNIAALLPGRTILVDADPQGNTSAWFLGQQNPLYELADVLTGNKPVAECIVQSEMTPGLDLLISFGLGGQLKTYGENQLANEPFVFVDLVEELNRLGYRHAVFDLSPGMGRLERSVLLAVDEVVTPMTPEHFSLDGIQIFDEEIQRLAKQMRRRPTWKRLVVNAMNRTIDQHKRILARAQESSLEVHVVPQDAAFRKAQAAGIPVFALDGADKPHKATVAALTKLQEALWR